MEQLDKLIEESVKLEMIKTEINCRFNAYVELLPEWEKELKDYIKKDWGQAIIKLKEKHIVQLNAKIEVLTELKKAI
jgi:hypothetical protein